MNFWQLPVIIGLGFLLLQGGQHVLGQTTDDVSIVPDKSTQLLLDQLHSATTEAVAKAAMKEIKEKSKGNVPSLFPQVICYRAGIKRKLAAKVISSQEAEKLLTGTYSLLKEIAPTQDAIRNGGWKLDILNAIAPYLGTTNALQKEQLEWVLGKVDYKGARERDYGTYRMFLKKSSDVSSFGLVVYMYDHDPKAAVLTMADVYADDATRIELTDQLKGDSKSILKSFADRPEWWVRLYVAETMKKQPQLRDEVILKKLEKDDNSLVREKSVSALEISINDNR